MKYKAIIFDLFGTLIDNLLSYQYRQILVEITDILSVEQDRFINLWLEYSDERMTGKLNNRESLELVCQKTGLTPTDRILENCQRVFTNHVRSRLDPLSSTLTTLSNLRERGYNIGLISNCSNEVILLWDDSPLASVIQYPVFSSSVGLKKPDIEIYLIAAEKIGVNPGECIFVDDSVEYLRGASEVGMTGVLIQDRTLNSSRSTLDDWDGYSIFTLSEIDILLSNVE